MKNMLKMILPTDPVPEHISNGKAWLIACKPERYFYLTMLIVFLHVFIMYYVIPKDWFNSTYAQRLIGIISDFVPMLRRLRGVPMYTNYWGTFYSFFWLFSPVFPILGVMTTFCKIEEKRLLLISLIPYKKIVLSEILFAIFFLFMFTIPEVGRILWFNEVSNNFFIILLTCLQIALILFALGSGIGLVRLKYSFNR